MAAKRGTVGLIGTGLMGTACAKRLRGAGFDVLAYDVDAAKLAGLGQYGVPGAGSIQEVARTCRTVVLAVFDTAQVEDVVENELLPVRDEGSGRIVMCASTCDPDRIAALVKRVPDERLRYVEASISGSSDQAARGEGLGLNGGEHAAIEEAADVLEAIVPRRRHIGPVGSGGRAKLAINLILGVNRAALAEGLVFAERMGLDATEFLAVARDSAAYSQVMDIKGAKMVRSEFSPQGFVAQSLKDFSLMAEQARRLHQRLPLAETYTSLMRGCVDAGEGELDNAAVIKEIRRRRIQG